MFCSDRSKNQGSEKILGAQFKKPQLPSISGSPVHASCPSLSIWGHVSALKIPSFLWLLQKLSAIPSPFRYPSHLFLESPCRLKLQKCHSLVPQTQIPVFFFFHFSFWLDVQLLNINSLYLYISFVHIKIHLKFKFFSHRHIHLGAAFTPLKRGFKFQAVRALVHGFRKNIEDPC